MLAKPVHIVVSAFRICGGMGRRPQSILMLHLYDNIPQSFCIEKAFKKIVEICNETFVSFIKTSTGYGSRGVTLEDIDNINKYKEEFLEIKASGGIRDIEMVNALLERGVTRLGISNIDFLKGK